MGKGFTAVELIVTILILSVLMTAVMADCGYFKERQGHGS